MQAGASRLERGGQAKKNPAGQRNDQGKNQDASVQRNLARARKVDRQPLQDSLRAPTREQQPDRASGEREQNALREELPKNSSAAGAQGSANRKFARPHRGASHHQIGDVHASDQEHETNGRKQHQKKESHLSDHRLLQGPHSRAYPLVDVRIFGRQAFRDSLHIGASLSEGDAWMEPADSMNAESSATLGEQGIAPLAERNEDIHVAETAEGKIETRRNHADDAVIPAVQRKRLAYCVW